MSFYQNPFDQEFQGNWVLGDRQYSLTFKVPANRNRTDLMISWNAEPYDLSTDNTLTLHYAFDKDFKNYASLAIDVSGATAAETTAAEVVTALNDNATFADYFQASIENAKVGGGELAGGPFRVVIRAKKPKHAFRAYVANGGAEKHLKFNRYAGVAELPQFYDRHTIARRFDYDDGQNLLVRLSHPITGNTVANPTVVTSEGHGLTTGDTIYIVNSNSDPVIDGERVVTVIDADTFSVPVNVTTAGTQGEWLSADEQQIVEDAGFDYSEMLEDWELLRGRTGLFMFRKHTVDDSDRITETIEYHAGAKAGDFARKIIYTYSGAKTKPDSQMEIPYVLQSGDLLNP